MAAAFAHDCPHCETRGASFEIRYEYRPPKFPDQMHAFVSCGVCQLPAAAVFGNPDGSTVTGIQLSLEAQLVLGAENLQLRSFYPKPTVPEAPEHLPENVQIYYLEAVANVKTSPNAAGAMFRTALEEGLKTIHSSAKKKETLQNRIDSAAAAGRITQDLAKWSHQVRVEGNNAVHADAPFTREEAKNLHRFTELVMMYLFTLPGMLKERRAREGAENTGEEAPKT